MGPMETTPSSPTFPVLDPIIVDDDMESAFPASGMDFLDPSRLQTSSEHSADSVDGLLARNTPSRTAADSESPCLSPGELSLKKQFKGRDTLSKPDVLASDSPTDSPEDSTRSSSSESPPDHFRESFNSSHNTANSESTLLPFGYSEDWVNSDFAGTKGDDVLFGLGPGAFGVEPDIESSNKAMDAAFDFESAASSPSLLKRAVASQPQVNLRSKSQFRSPSNDNKRPSVDSVISSPAPTRGSSFVPHGLPDSSSPLSMSTASGKARSASSQWAGQSPSSILEESFGGINVNGSSPLTSAASPNLDSGFKSLSSGMDFAQSPPQSNMQPDCSPRHVLTVHPTSLKSRVETQIPIRLTLYPLPTGVKKLRLPTHTISRPKFLARPPVERSPEILDLHTSLVCTSAMRDTEKLKKAFARARGEVPSPIRNSSDGSPEDGSPEDEEKPGRGGEVKICSGCIQRERKRASRKKQRKPEEDELFRKNEEKRVIVFNTNEIKDWSEPSAGAVTSFGDFSVPLVPAGAMQVELPMRIACYCRHQSEKLGFQVIFTVKDHMDNVVAQAITNSIMITDDHKTHAPVSPAVPSPGLPDGTQLPGVGVFHSGPNFNSLKVQKPAAAAQTIFRPSQSASDLQGLQQKFTPQLSSTPSPFAVPQSSASGTSSSNTPRSLSRQASPTDFPGPSSKRRKHSSSGKLPSELTMTRLETSQSSSLPTSHAFTSSADRPFVAPMSLSGHFTGGPPTPTSSDNNNPFFNPAVQHPTMDSLVRQQLTSTPNSIQRSRSGSPGDIARNSFHDQGLNLSIGPSTTSPMWPPMPNGGARLPSVIHKLVPAEGSITGGTEVTLLGSGFYPGMEVVFGDTLATTTTFWGDKCLNCLTPPALHPGLVPVVFKHEHPTFGQVPQSHLIMPKQQLFFRYVDDRELQMYRLALGILGHKLGNQADAFQTARQIMGSDSGSLFNLQKDYQGGAGGHQRQMLGLDTQGSMSDLDSKMLGYLEFVDLDDSPRSPRYSARCATGQTLLHFASSLGLTRFVAGLLARGANPEVQDNTGNTPMHLAAMNGHAHIVHRLRHAGASASARSVRGYMPADLATTLPAHQATLLPSRRRSRSVGSLASSRRRHSSVSIDSLWETSSASGSLDFDSENSDEIDEEAGSETESRFNDTGLYYAQSRRPSVHRTASSSQFYTRSREGSVQTGATPTEETVQPEDARGFSPPAAIVAWRNHLAAQINQFQQSVSNAFPNLPALPPMPALPDYQAHPMMRRITNLVPNRPNTEGWWDLLKGNSSPSNNAAPPSYDELYPHNEIGKEEASRLKKTSLVRAATDAALDQHFEAQPSSSKSATAEPKDDIQDIRIGRKWISREQQRQLREQQARRMKGLGSDRKLYFVWIPLLLLVIFAWARNFVPGVWQGVLDGYEFVRTQYYTDRHAVDVDS